MPHGCRPLPNVLTILTVLTPIGTLNGVPWRQLLKESITDVTPQREDMGSKAFFVIDSLSS
jgi:hypothetical protein